MPTRVWETQAATPEEERVGVLRGRRHWWLRYCELHQLGGTGGKCLCYLYPVISCHSSDNIYFPHEFKKSDGSLDSVWWQVVGTALPFLIQLNCSERKNWNLDDWCLGFFSLFLSITSNQAFLLPAKGVKELQIELLNSWHHSLHEDSNPLRPNPKASLWWVLERPQLFMFYFLVRLMSCQMAYLEKKWKN